MNLTVNSHVSVIIASQTGAMLDSNVYTGGGTDDTAVLQSALDMAQSGGVHLIMDGAARVTGLTLYSNTTIECLNKDCGFYLSDHVNHPILRNAHPDFKSVHDKNIRIIGGTYHNNCLHQEHDIPLENSPYPEIAAEMKVFRDRYWTKGFEFIGVEGLSISGITLRDQRTFGMLIANWKHVDMSDIVIDLQNHMDAQNQDGVHFWGPGQFLNIRNICGSSGDDFIALAPDEHDKTSGITDVLIDGVFLDHADQGIRMLSRGTGRLDRVTVRNVTGTYKSYGFYINAWFPGETYGNFGSIVFENIDLRQSEANYDYTAPFLFRLGANIESIVFRNIIHHHALDQRALFEIGIPFYNTDYRHPTNARPVIESMVIEGLHIANEAENAAESEYIKVFNPVKHMVLRNVDILRNNMREPAGCAICLRPHGEIDTLLLQNISCDNLSSFVQAHEGKIHTLMITNTLSRNLKHGFSDHSDICVEQFYQTNMF